MAQKISIFIYLIFIGVVTFFVASYSEAEKIVEYLKDNQYEFSNDQYKLVSATSIANQNTSKLPIIFKEKLFSNEFKEQSNLNSLTVDIFSMVENSDGNKQNSIAILVSHLTIGDEDAFIDDDKYSTLLARIVFDQDVTIGNTTKSEFLEGFMTLYDDKSKMIIINYDKINSENSFPLIRVLTLSYETIDNKEKELVTLYNSDINNVDSINFNDFNRDIKNLNEENIKLTKRFNNEELLDSELFFFDFGLIEKFNSYFYLYVKNIGIELLIVIPLTYFLYFNKYVMKKLRELRQQKLINERNEIEALKEKLRNEEEKK